MSSFRTSTTLSALGILVALSGCSAESATGAGAGTAGTAQVADTVAADPAAANAHVAGPARGFHPGGPDFLLVAALREPTIDLTADQKTTIEGALAASKPVGPAGFDKTRVSALAAGIRSGKVDAATVKAQAPSDDAKAAHLAAAAKAVATLHATLTPVQRRALVDALAKHAADHASHPPMDHAGGPPPGGMGPMEHMLEGLDVTQAQKDAIRAKLDAQRPAPPTDTERAAMKQQHEAMRALRTAKLQTFANDTFDANAFVAPPDGALKGPGPDHADRFAADLAIITSVLEPAQREKLAARIEAGPPARMGKPIAAPAP